MVLGWVTAGLIAGLALSGGRSLLLSGVFGMAIGYLFALLRQQRTQLDALETKLKALSAAASGQPDTVPAAAPPHYDFRDEPLAPARDSVDEPAPAVSATPAQPVPPSSLRPSAGRPAAIEPWPQDKAAGPSLFDKGVEAAKRWFTTGNVPVKLGVIITFFGVAFLLKYAVDRKLLALPIELRLLAVAAGAIALLAFGWRLRKSNPVYALSLQGGAVGILFLTIFAGMRLYALIPAPLAFGLLVALTAFTGVLAVVQDAKALAILGIVGGFLAPVLVSTGAGSHVALFGYYLVLNGAILGIAWYRTWRELNLLGFVFTFVIAGLWGYRYYRPEHFATTEPFLILHFLLYQAVAILFSYRQLPRLKGVVDGTLVFGTPVIAFAMQAALLKDNRYGLAFSAVIVALFYLPTAVWIFRHRGREMRMLAESYLALAIGFATLAVPLALDARWTAGAWALEGAALTWIGMRQQRLLAKLSGIGLIMMSGLSFVVAGIGPTAGLPVANGDFLSALLISLAAWFAARQLDTAEPALGVWHRPVAAALAGWGTLWWFAGAWLEIDARTGGGTELHWVAAHLAFTGALVAYLARRLDWSLARRFLFAYLPALVLLAVAQVGDGQYRLDGWGGPAWVALWAVQFIALKTLESGKPALAEFWHGATAVALTLFGFTRFLLHGRDAGLPDVWLFSIASVLIGLAILFVLSSGRLLAWPIGEHRKAWLAGACVLSVCQLACVAAIAVASGGAAAPLPYLPLLNPFDIATAFALLMAAQTYRRVDTTTSWLANTRSAVQWLAWLTAFVLTTLAVVRGMHHALSIPWQADTLVNSVAIQAALSVYWGLLGVAAMVLGTRRSRRLVWMAGAALMGLVTVKLFLVDLGNTATVARIISFLGVGGLLLLVGYFAPAPPRDETADDKPAVIADES